MSLVKHQMLQFDGGAVFIVDLQVELQLDGDCDGPW
jgi:hypothetical protein